MGENRIQKHVSFTEKYEVREVSEKRWLPKLWFLTIFGAKIQIFEKNQLGSKNYILDHSKIQYEMLKGDDD